MWKTALVQNELEGLPKTIEGYQQQEKAVSDQIEALTKSIENLVLPPPYTDDSDTMRTYLESTLPEPLRLRQRQLSAAVTGASSDSLNYKTSSLI